MPGIAVLAGDEVYFGLRQGTTTARTFRLPVNLVDKRGVPSSLILDVASSGTARAVASARKTISVDGWINSASVEQTSTSSFGPGEAFAEGYLFRQGSKIAGIVSGYIYDGHIPTYPGFYQGNMEGPGALRVITGTNPAANTEISETVPNGAFWRLEMFSAVLVTDANAANRVVSVIVDDGTGTERIWAMQNTTAHTASLTRTHLFTRGTRAPVGASTSLTDTQVVLINDCIPSDIFLAEGYRIRTVTSGLQVTDDYAAPIFAVREWLIDLV